MNEIAPADTHRTRMSKNCRSDGRRRVDIVLGHRVIVFVDMRADSIDQRRMQRIHSFRPGQDAGRGLPEIRLRALSAVSTAGSWLPPTAQPM